MRPLLPLGLGTWTASSALKTPSLNSFLSLLLLLNANDDNSA